MGKTTAQTSQTSSPPPQVLANYQALVDRATNVANTPYTPYNGQVVPDLTQNQQQAFNQMSSLYGYSDPLYMAAAQYTGQGATPLNLSAGYTGQFVSPYAQSGAANANAAGQGLAAYGTNAGQGLAGYGVNAGQGLGAYGTSAGQGIGAYGTNAAQGITGLAQNIGQSGPQLQQYNSQNLQGFLNPYTQSVVDTTLGNINRSNAIQQNDLTGSAIKAGNAFGGDRAGVAAAELARNQDLSRDQTIAQLESSGFQNAQSQFNANNQQALAGQQTALSGLASGSQLGLGALGTGAQLGLSGLSQGAQLGLSGLGQGAQLGLSGQQAGGQLGLAGSTLGNQGYQTAQQLALAQQQQQNSNALQASGQLQSIGNQMYNNQLTAAQAQLAAGNQQQQQQAAQLAWPYQQYQQALAFPYQQTQFLGNAVLGTGSASGGTGTTTSPGPNIASQVIGGIGTGVGALGATGAFGSAGWLLPAMAALKDGGGIKSPYRANGGGIAAENIQPIDFSSGPLGLAGIKPNMGMIQARGRGAPYAPRVAASLPSNSLGSQTGGGLGGFGGAGNSSPFSLPLSGPAWGGGNFMTDVYGGNSQHPLEGLTADDYGPGYRGGGLVSPFRALGGLAGPASNGGLVSPFMNNLSFSNGGGLRRAPGLGRFADGGDIIDATDLPPLGEKYLGLGQNWSPTNAAIDNDVGGPPQMPPQPQGLASMASPPTTPDQAPAGPVPMPQARPQGLGSVAGLPPEITAGQSGDMASADQSPPGLMGYAPQSGAGLSAAPSPFTSPQGDQSPDTAAALQGASPYAGLQEALQRHAAPKPDPWMALMQAGLGMMASRSPTLLGGIGEGGAAGLANWQQQQKAYNSLDAHPIIDRSGPTTLIVYPGTGDIVDTGIPTETAAQKSARDMQATQQAETARHNKAMEEQGFPSKIVTDNDPNTGEIRHYVFDPDSKQLTRLKTPDDEGAASDKFVSTAAPVADRRKAPAASPDARDESYYEYLQSHRPPGYADVVRAVADYEIDPNREASLQKGARDRLYRDVKQYDPTYDQTHFAEKSGVIQNFSRGPASQAVNSLNVSVAHLETLRQLGDALQNGNIPVINRVSNAVSAQLGRPAPTNFEAAKEIVGDEVVKAVVGGVNSQADREAIKHLILAQQTPAQLNGVIKTFQTLLGGQLDGQRQRYQAGTGLNNFDQKYLAPATRDALTSARGGAASPEVMRMVYPSGIPKEAASGAPAAPPPPASVPTATGPNGQKLYLRNGQWVNQ